MKIKCLMDFLDGRHRYTAGDVVTVDDESGEYFVTNGWAEDVDGNIETGEIKNGEVRLDIRNIEHSQSTQTK